MNNITGQMEKMRISGIGWSNYAGKNLRNVKEIPSRNTYNYMKEQVAANRVSQGPVWVTDQKKGRKTRRSPRKSRRSNRKAQTRHRR